MGQGRPTGGLREQGMESQASPLETRGAPHGLMVAVYWRGRRCCWALMARPETVVAVGQAKTKRSALAAARAAKREHASNEGMSHGMES